MPKSPNPGGMGVQWALRGGWQELGKLELAEDELLLPLLHRRGWDTLRLWSERVG